MKKKPSHDKRGRKKFSAGKLISPDNDLEENLAIAAGGEFAVAAPQDRAINSLVLLWPNYYAPLFRDATASHHLAEQKRERITARILKIITDALDRMDSEPFETFIRAIKFMQAANQNGPLLLDAFEILRVADEMALTLGRDKVQSVSVRDFKKRLRRQIEDRQFARIKKSIGLHFKSGRPKA